MEHKLIVDADRHEPKGSSTATLNQVLKAAGDGSTFFGFVNKSEIVGAGTKVGYKKSIYAESSAASQLPSSTNTKLQVEFGSAQSVTDVTLDSTGILTFVTAGQYLIDLAYNFGRTSAAGTSIVIARCTLNGTQLGPSNAAVLTSESQIIPSGDFLLVDAAAGDKLRVEVIRSAAGINDGGLYQIATTMSGWNGSPSASMSVYKFIGEQ
jgi:hypothetical protein